MKSLSSLLLFACIGFANIQSVQSQNVFLEDYLSDFSQASDKLISLAETIPEETYPWSPEGARSVSEVFVHIASANFFLSATLGAPMPDNFPADAEQSITKKADVIDVLKKSMESVRTAAEKNMDMDLNQEVEAFGQKFSRRALFLLIGGHNHEHMGQSIAYARMNGIVPPWSQ